MTTYMIRSKNMNIFTPFDYLYYRLYCFSERYYTFPHTNSLGLWILYVVGPVFSIGIFINDLFKLRMDAWWIIFCCIISLIGGIPIAFRYKKKIAILKQHWKDETPSKHKLRSVILLVYLLIDLSSVFIFHKIVYGVWTGY